MWLESVTDMSFKVNENQDYSSLSTTEIGLGKGSITKWYDRNPHPDRRKNAINSLHQNAPKYYHQCLNSIPCIRFNGSSNFFEVENSDSLQLSDYSIFIVEKRDSSSAMPIISASSTPSLNSSIEIGYLNSNSIYWNQGSSSEQKSYIINDFEQEKVKLHSFINARNSSAASNLKYFLNQNLILSTDSSTPIFSTLQTSSQLLIGKSYNNNYYSGSIGEVIIIPFAVSKQQRIAIQRYLLNKWAID